jgi:hypothetical protein
MECPFVNRSFTPDPAHNTPVVYRPLGGTEAEDYIFYDHDDGTGKISRVQFCQLIGRKRDVFECLNESEWTRCRHYRWAADEEKAGEG